MGTNRERITEAIRNGEIPANPPKSSTARETQEYLHKTEVAQAKRSAELDREGRHYVG